MNSPAHRQAVQEAARAAFRGHKRRICKTKPIYPQSVEREFQRLTDAYMKLLKAELQKHLPEIRAAAQAEAGQRHDGINDLIAFIQQLFVEIREALEQSVAAFGLRRKVERIAYMLRKLSIKEWKRAVHAVLGIDIFEDYYMGEFYREAISRWVETNVGVISTIPQSTLDKMENIILDGFRNGRPTKSIMKEIQKTYSISKGHARLIARDQIAKLNGELSRQQQLDAGVKEYIWSDSRDGRVRDSHRSLNGKRFSWNDPPVVDIKRGRRCHPGQDYQCRCVPLPVFDIDTLDLPISMDQKGDDKS